jgi:peptide/nickel transport system substrate-binding protein
MDKLLDASRVAKGDKEKATIYKRVQELAELDVPGVMPYVVKAVNAHRKGVNNFHSHPLMWLDLKGVSLTKQ